MPDTALWRLDAVDLARLIRLRKVSSREAVQATLDRMAAVNPRINAVVLPLAEEALAAADAADLAIARGEAAGPLHGVPVTTKVNSDQKGCPTDNGVVAYKDVIAPEDGAVVANLRHAGAVIVGRTNTPAFSMRWFTDNALHGLTKNPWAADRTAGGSSGGAAAATAVGIGAVGQGNDIAGSVRYPAYCCGLAGLRPSYGRVPSFNGTATGHSAISSQLMAVQGPLTRRVRDLRPALAAMAANDLRDPRWVPAPLEGPPPQRPIRVALCVDPGGQGVHPAVGAAVRRAGLTLAEAGYAVEEAEPPEFDAVADLWGAIAMDDVIQPIEQSAAQHGDADVRRALAFWRARWPKADMARFQDGLARRNTFLRLWQAFLETYPIIVMPVSTEPPFKVGDDVRDAETTARMIHAQRPQIAVPVLGLPAVSVPVGLHEGVPVGVQVVAGRFREDLCIGAAEVIEAQGGLATPIDPRF